jgi:hypothetical protein
VIVDQPSDARPVPDDAELFQVREAKYLGQVNLR